MKKVLPNFDKSLLGEKLSFKEKILGLIPRRTEEVLYNIAIPNLKNAITRGLKAKAKFDLARLVLASRIEELETGKSVSNIRELIPKYFPDEPKDPFSEQPYLWDSASKTFYSIGPDKLDDQNLLQYDPTNGTISNGDISFQ